MNDDVIFRQVWQQLSSLFRLATDHGLVPYRIRDTADDQREQNGNGEQQPSGNPRIFRSGTRWRSIFSTPSFGLTGAARLVSRVSCT